MLKSYFPKILLFALVINAYPAMAFDCQNTDKQLSEALAMSSKYGSYGVFDERDDGKKDTANEQIEALIAQISKDSASMVCQFNQANEQGLHLQTSNDKKFRAFSWDSNSSGTLHEFVTSIQYIDDKGVSHTYPLEDTNFVTSIFSTSVQGKPLYLLTTTGVYSTMDNGQSLTLYQIEGDKLISPKLIKTKAGVTNQLAFEYNFFSVVNRPERPIKLFEFDKNSKTIDFPVVIETNEFRFGKVTNQKIRYQFDGNYFIRK